MAESSSSSGWEFIDKDGKRVESSDDNYSETSESSIEVVSMDTSDLQSLDSIQEPHLPSASSGSFLVLRLRSKEKDSLTESDESDDQDTLKRRRKQKSRQPRALEPELTTPSEGERDFVTLPDPPKQSAECANREEDQVVEETQNMELADAEDSVPRFQIVGAPEDQQPAPPHPFDEDNEEEEDFLFLGVPQDDPDTESSPELEDEQDDRMESDRGGDPFSDDYSTLSNVDISDLMAENNLIRQYVFRPNPNINVTLNMVMLVVISVAVGLGIGHAIGSAKERFSHTQIQEMSGNMDIDGDCPFDLEDVEKLTAENRELKEEANMAQNEVTDLRSEVIKLRYSPVISAAEDGKKEANRRNVALKSEVNMLQHENEDLKKLVGSLKYGSHPGNAEGGCPKRVADGKLNKIEDPTKTASSLPHLNKEKSNTASLDEESQVNMEGDGYKDGMKKPMGLRDIIVNPVSSGNTPVPELNVEKEREMYSDISDHVEDDKGEEYEALPKESNEQEEEEVEILDEDLGDKWAEDEEVSNVSKEDIPKAEEGANTRSTDHEKSDRGIADQKMNWRETMQKILNKTKASVSDVSQQIQDTWKQVKNMSEDLWKKKEPVLTKLKTDFVTKVGEAAQKISSKLEKTKHWFTKKRKHHEKYPQHKRNEKYYPARDKRHEGTEGQYPKHRQNDDIYRENRQRHQKKSKYYKAKTGRRSYREEKTSHKQQKKEQAKAKRFEMKRNNKFNKIKGRFQRMHEYHFCRMNMGKRHKFFDILEQFDERFNADKMSNPDHKWYSCQWDWWLNAVSFHLHTFLLMDPTCHGELMPWQEGILDSGRWECPGFPLNLMKKHDDDDDDDDKDDLSYHTKFSEEEDLDDEDDKKNFKNMPHFEDSELSSKSNYTEEFKGCDPTKGICDFNKNDSWYLKKMKFRQYQRFIDAQERGKTDWMFSRAGHRSNEREPHISCVDF